MHAIAPESAAPCDADFLLVHRNILAKVRLPRDAVPRHRMHHGDRCLHRAYLRRVLVHACNRPAAVSGSSHQRFCTAGRLQSWITAHLLKCFILQTSSWWLFASSPRPHSIISTTTKGQSVKSVCAFFHYAFGSVMGHGLCYCPLPPLLPRGRMGVFRRREVPPRQPHSGIPFVRL